MPPKGWKKPSNAAVASQVAAIGGAVAGMSIGAPVGQIPGAMIAQQFSQPTQNIPQMQQEHLAQSPGARKSGLSARLDPIARERIIAVNDVTIRCVGSLGKFDFKAMWLKGFPDEIPAGELTSRLKSAVMAADDIWINCKQRRPNDPEVTINHSRHEANWLKEYV